MCVDSESFGCLSVCIFATSVVKFALTKPDQRNLEPLAVFIVSKSSLSDTIVPVCLKRRETRLQFLQIVSALNFQWRANAQRSVSFKFSCELSPVERYLLGRGLEPYMKQGGSPF